VPPPPVHPCQSTCRATRTAAVRANRTGRTTTEGTRMGLLEGSVALITGGARGQGRAHAVTCAREGADVIVLDAPGALSTVPYELAGREDLDETVAAVRSYGKQALAVSGDVRSQVDLDAAVAAGAQEFGNIDILIANAGIWAPAPPFWEISEAEWDQIMDVNLTGVWKSAKAVAPFMIDRQSGSIVVISSIAGLEAGEHYAHYSSSKHGVLGLMRNMALDLAPHGVRCNAVCPGAIATPMLDHQQAWDRMAGRPGGTRDDMFAGGHHFAALRGVGLLDPQVVADAALFLSSRLAAAITGEAVVVDAGHLLLPGYNAAPIHEDPRDSMP
jgi:SDR family mycofactocin-dependent oxidoreductase